MKGLPDYIKPGLKILFIGFNPGLTSAEQGRHYAGKNNRFWRLLLDAGLTDRLYRPEEDCELLKLGFGLTNIVGRPTRRADEITKTEFREGSRALYAKIKKYRPQFAAYVGKGIYRHFSGKTLIPWGLQTEHMAPPALDYVCPSSSGLVRMSKSEMVRIYRGLGALLEKSD